MFATYSMEESRKAQGEESKRFVEALITFSGDTSATDAKEQPRIFKYDISEVVEELELSATGTSSQSPFLQVMEKIRCLSVRASNKLSADQAKKQHETGRFYDVVERLTRDKVFLPSKDLTHLLVFDSKVSELRFRELLSARTPVGNFIMEGSIDAAKLFNLSIKRGTPVFVMQGSGGAADKLALVLKHMHWRKQLDMEGADSDSDNDSDHEGASCFSCLSSCFTSGSENKEENKEDEEDQHKAEDEDKWLNLGVMMKNLEERKDDLSKKVDQLKADGHFERALPQREILLGVEETLEKAKSLKQGFLESIEAAKQKTSSDAQHDEKIAGLHKNFFNLVEEYEERVSSSYTGRGINDGESIGSASKVGSVGASANSGRVKPTKRAANPEAVYKEDLSAGKEGVAWEKRNNQSFEKWFKDGGHVHNNDPPPEDWVMPFEGNEECIKRIHPQTGVTIPCYEETCSLCGPFKRKHRNFLRKLAMMDKKWRKLDNKLRSKYIRFWQDDNSLDDEVVLVNGKARLKDATTELCRVIFNNVYEPPVPEAVVTIDMLDPDISYEDVMDKVTAAMSADTLVVEVHTKRARTQAERTHVDEAASLAELPP